jgi:hypothetical protein
MRVEYAKHIVRMRIHIKQKTQRLSSKKFQEVFVVDECACVLSSKVAQRNTNTSFYFLPAPAKNVLFGNQRTPTLFCNICHADVEGKYHTSDSYASLS